MYFVPELETIPCSPANATSFPSTPTVISTTVTGDVFTLSAGVPFASLVTPCQEAFTPVASALVVSDGSTPAAASSVPEPRSPFCASGEPSSDCSALAEDGGHEAKDWNKRNSTLSIASSNDDRGRRISFASVTRAVTTSIGAMSSSGAAAMDERESARRTSLVIDHPGNTPLLLVTPSIDRTQSLSSFDQLSLNTLGVSPRGSRRPLTMPRSPAPGRGVELSASSASLPAWFHSATSRLDDGAELIELSLPLWLDRRAGLKAPHEAQQVRAVVPATDVSELPAPAQRFIPGTLVLQRDDTEDETSEVLSSEKELCMDPECSVCAVLNSRESFQGGQTPCRTRRLSNHLRRSASQLIAKLDETGRVPTVASVFSTVPVPLGVPPPGTPVVNDQGHKVLWFGPRKRDHSRSARLRRKVSRMALKFKKLATHDLAKGPIKERLPDSPQTFCIISSREASCESDWVKPILVKRSPYLERWDLDAEDEELQETLESLPSAKVTSVPLGKRGTPWDCV